MSRARGLLVLAMVSSAAACTLTESLSGLTGGGGTTDGGSDVGPDTTTNDASDVDTRVDAGDAGDAATSVDASDGGSSGDVVQPDVATGPVSCADAGVILCEDFESGLDSMKWATTSMYASPMVDTTQHHRGNYALHVIMPALTTDGSALNVAGSIRHTTTTTLPSPLFVRAFVMFSSAQPQGTEAFLVAQQSGSPYYGLQLELDQQTGDYSVTDWTVNPNFYVASSLPAAATTWNCVEWELDPPDGGTTMTNSDVWIDAGEVSSLHLANTPMTDLEVLGFGIGFYQVTSLPAYDLWIDDIYVDTMRVGCDK